jgi:hypothetical protein
MLSASQEIPQLLGKLSGRHYRTAGGHLFYVVICQGTDILKKPKACSLYAEDRDGTSLRNVGKWVQNVKMEVCSFEMLAGLTTSGLYDFRTRQTAILTAVKTSDLSLHLHKTRHWFLS